MGDPFFVGVVLEDPWDSGQARLECWMPPDPSRCVSIGFLEKRHAAARRVIDEIRGEPYGRLAHAQWRYDFGGVRDRFHCAILFGPDGSWFGVLNGRSGHVWRPPVPVSETDRGEPVLVPLPHAMAATERDLGFAWLHVEMCLDAFPKVCGVEPKPVAAV